VAERYYLYTAVYWYKEARVVAQQSFYIEAAFDFYEQFILKYSQAKAAIYQRYGFTLQGSVSPKEWEVFAAILLDDRARSGNGADLINHEVKSAMTTNNGFEYQYHKTHGLEKLAADKTVDHVFISLNPTYTNIEVWWVDREHLIPTFDSWLPELRTNYQANGKQRFRRSISRGTVRQYGQKILVIDQGQLSHSTGSELPTDSGCDPQSSE
jgi:hypothetical protein